MTRRAVAIRLRPRAGLAVGIASLVGLVAFCWPFVLAPGRLSSYTAPLLFGVLLLLVLAVLLAELADGGIDAKALAMLGVLSAVGAALRPLGAGTAGVETMFFLLVLAGRVFGAGFGFSLGCTSLFASALITGGVGPWLPYQMFGSAFVGLLAGLLPPLRGRAELAMLAAFGAVSGYLYGFLLNLSSWPFLVDPHSSVSYLPGLSFTEQWHRYLAYDAATSLGWDTGRAVTTLVCVLLAGPAALATFRRAARRARFEAVPEFDSAAPRQPQASSDGGAGSSSSRCSRSASQPVSGRTSA